MWRHFIILGLFLLAAPVSAQAPSVREQLLAVALTKNLGGATTQSNATRNAFSMMAANADPSRQAQFELGNQMFIVEWQLTPGLNPLTDGLGPLFNRDSCIGCHRQNGRGRAPNEPGVIMRSMLLRLSVPGSDQHGGPKPVPNYGDQLQDSATVGVPPEGRADITWSETTGQFVDGVAYTLRKPSFSFSKLGYGDLPQDVMVSPRVANAMIGLGLLEAVPTNTMLTLADPDDADNDGISGRVNMVWDEPSRAMQAGRFGWKANVASLAHQIAGAARGDIGLTTPVFRSDVCEPIQSDCTATAKKSNQSVEISESVFNPIKLFVQLVAVPEQRNADDPSVVRGEVLFRGMGCANCHMPTLRTDETASLPELPNQTFHPFTDLLIHDMGDGLADNRPDYLASGREWRTAPLWGIGLTKTVSGHTNFLHDGRARDITEAILWHGGEADAAKEKFRAAGKSTRDDLLAFLNSL